MKKNKVVILDPGHGENTLGKCSPDKSFYEWKWARMFAAKLKAELENLGYIVHLTTNGTYDYSLSTRASRANSVIDTYGAGNCVFISIHCNAAGNGDKWYTATGWEVYTTTAKTNSDKLAECLANEVTKEGIKLRSDMTDGDKDKEANFTVIYKTNCPSILTENMFMDSKTDLEFLKSEDGIRKLLNIHINGINNYFNND